MNVTGNLTRSRTDKYVAGVCGGLARYLNVDAGIVRLLAVIGLVIAGPAVIGAYVVLWILLPYEDGGVTGLDSLKKYLNIGTNPGNLR